MNDRIRPGGEAVKDLDQVPHIPEDEDCACMLCRERPKPYWRPGSQPGTAYFDLGRYLRDKDEQERKDNWERTFGRKERLE